MRGHHAHRTVAAFAAACAFACTAGPEPSEERSAEQAAEQAAQPAAPALSDADIAAIVVAANELDAQAGEIALERASSHAVREFGRTMVTDHRAINEQAGALVARLGVTPTENAVSGQLRSDAASVQSDLRTKTGAEFDRAYIAHEVAYHQAVIDAVDQLLIPGAQNEELRETLVAVRPALVAHLRHAQQLQTALVSSQ